MRLIVKKIWKSLPTSLRELPLRYLCSLSAPHKERQAPLAEGYPIYVVGNFRAGGGIARSADLYARNMMSRQASQRVDTTREMLQESKNNAPDTGLLTLDEMKKYTAPATLVIHLTPPQFLWLLCKLGRNFLRNKRIVAYWAWELEDIPDLWRHALRFVDAVEVPSSFTMRAIAKNTDKPVTVHPHPREGQPHKRDFFTENGKLRCLYIFDMASLCSRKNPQAVINAFGRAFSPEQGTLTIKLGQAGRYPQELAQLRALAAPHPHIRFLMDWLDAEGLKRLYREHDVYLSLHRSEGYGLTIQEAMQHGLYVVATGWSGNMDFMAGERCVAVPYTLVPVERESGMGAGRGLRWAEADIEFAAASLRRIRKQLLGEGE